MSRDLQCSASVISTPSDSPLSDLEVQLLEVKHPLLQAPMLLCNIYRPPSSSTNRALHSLFNIIQHGLSKWHEVLICGDLNVNLLRKSPSSCLLKEYCQDLHLHLVIDSPTRITESSASLVDIFLTSNPNSIISSYSSWWSLQESSRVPEEVTTSDLLINQPPQITPPTCLHCQHHQLALHSLLSNQLLTVSAWTY